MSGGAAVTAIAIIVTVAIANTFIKVTSLKFSQMIDAVIIFHYSFCR